MDIIERLLISELFEKITKEEIEHILNTFAHKIVDYGKNDVVALSGDKCNNLILVLKGGLIARMVSDSGKFIQIEKLGIGRVVAPAILFASDNQFPVNVIPEGDVQLLFMSRNVFLDALKKHDQLLINFIQIISNINSFLSNKIHFLSLRSLREKLIEYILAELDAQNSKGFIELKITRQELADKFGVSRQSLIRSLTELEDENLISVEGKTVKLINLKA